MIARPVSSSDVSEHLCTGEKKAFLPTKLFLPHSLFKSLVISKAFSLVFLLLHYRIIIFISYMKTCQTVIAVETYSECF